MYVGGGANDEPQYGHALQAYRVDPRPGRWKLVVNVTNPVGGNAQSAPLRGHIGFDPPDVDVRGLPAAGERLRAGQPVQATIRVHNDGPAPEDVFVDARRPRLADLPLLSLTRATGVPLPIPGDQNPPFFLVPTQTRTLVGAAEASAPIVLELGFGIFGEGDPDLRGVSAGNRAVAAYRAPEVAPGPWFLAPALRGPFDAPASGTVNTGMLARTAAFARDVSSSTGDLWQATVDPEAPDFTPLTLAPGARGTIRVTLTPRGRSGSVHRGVLYLDDFSNQLFDGNEQLAIPYRYRIR